MTETSVRYVDAYAPCTNIYTMYGVYRDMLVYRRCIDIYACTGSGTVLSNEAFFVPVLELYFPQTQSSARAFVSSGIGLYAKIE